MYLNTKHTVLLIFVFLYKLFFPFVLIHAVKMTSHLLLGKVLRLTEHNNFSSQRFDTPGNN